MGMPTKLLLCIAIWIYVSIFKLKQNNPLFLPVFIAALLPLGRLAWLGFQNELTANPIEFITRSTGTWSLIFLCITLSLTPIHSYFRAPRLLQLRRTLGLFSFFYACLHFSTWLALDHQFDWHEITKDLLKRTYLTIGLITFALFIPLAITSNKYSQTKLGRAWKRLHRITYIVAILALLHYWRHKAGKNDYEMVAIYSMIVIALLGWRVNNYLRKFR